MMEYKLTQYSHGAGCGCKISPETLTEILGSTPFANGSFPALIVGNEGRDDAAVFDLGDGTALISTTDFFMPIVDDARTFGHIASVNAISDVYAMGGRPLMAIAILGWPVEKLPAHVANQVVEGARAACADAGIPLAGGHSIDSPEPIFGLAVSGKVDIRHLRRNTGAQDGDLIYLTKPVGIGIFTTAQKRGLLADAHHDTVVSLMMQLNKVGAQLGECAGVHAMTDVTGFGLAGHLLEMCADGVRAEIVLDRIPLIDHEAIQFYIGKGCIPGGTHRNYKSYGKHIAEPLEETTKYLVCDPQTSGGLLIATDPAHSDMVESVLKAAGAQVACIGAFRKAAAGEPLLKVS